MSDDDVINIRLKLPGNDKRMLFICFKNRYFLYVSFGNIEISAPETSEKLI